MHKHLRSLSHTLCVCVSQMPDEEAVAAARATAEAHRQSLAAKREAAGMSGRIQSARIQRINTGEKLGSSARVRKALHTPCMGTVKSSRQCMLLVIRTTHQDAICVCVHVCSLTSLPAIVM